VTPERSVKSEIQGLRAIAVGLVLIFHVWPWALPGGYVGVDVFFVISGYLITGLLVRDAMRDGRISLLDFYSRRARRLLPAATAVLFATFAGMLVFLPKARWEETAIQIAASALYVQNWVLAWLSGDYLGAENAASPVQHYWSLSIEEQFYVVWPLVMIAAIAASRRLGLPMRRVFLAALATIFASSFALSLALTAQDAAQAYYVTHTRMWELAMGGMLALTIHRWRAGMAVRCAMLVFGLGAIAWSAFAYSRTTAFPGYAALLPTLGSVLVIMAGEVRAGRFHGLDAGWLSWVGDRSYSIYLWHWPLIVFYVAGAGQIGLVEGIGLVALTLAISHLSYHYIEQPWRHAKGRGEWRPLAYGATSIAACVLISVTISYGISSKIQPAIAASDPDYPGPAALLTGAAVPEGVEPLPSLAALRRDLPVVYQGEACHQNQRDSDPKHCVLGDPMGEKTVAITGDSHAAQWVPGLERLAIANGWRLVTLTKSACALARVELRISGGPYPSCAKWRENAIDWIKQNGVDIVFTSQSRYEYIDAVDMSEGLRSVWMELMDAGVQVVPIHDTPWMPFEPGDCLAGDIRLCAAPRAEVEASRVMHTAAEALPEIEVLDLTNAICGPESCEAVVGNLIVWRDRHHLTATYATALAPYIATKLGVPFQVSAVAAGHGPQVVATLSCAALGTGAPLARRITLEVKDGAITHRFGNWRDQKVRFDLWAGRIDGERVTVSGHYTEGAGGVKGVAFSGTITNGRLRLEGTRGPRDCILIADLRPARST
jgi:peptidoglycan/LPS O-acetylase OafA/YrhL